MVTTSQSEMDHGPRRTPQPTQHRYPRIKTCGLLPFALAMIRLGQIVGVYPVGASFLSEAGSVSVAPHQHRYDHRAAAA